MKKIKKMFCLSVILLVFSNFSVSAKEGLDKSQDAFFDPVSFSNQIRSVLASYRPTPERKWGITTTSDPTFVKNGSKYSYTIPGLVINLSTLKSRIEIGDLKFSLLPNKHNNLVLSLSVRDHLDLLNHLGARLGKVSIGSNDINFIWDNSLNTISRAFIELSKISLKIDDVDLAKIEQASYEGEIISNSERLWASNLNFEVSKLSATGFSVGQIKGFGAENFAELPKFIDALREVGHNGSAGSWFLGGTQIFPSLWDKILSPDQILSLITTLADNESMFRGSEVNYDISKFKARNFGYVDEVKISGGYKRGKSEFFGGKVKLAFEKIGINKPGIEKSILKLLPSYVGLNYSLENLRFGNLMHHLKDFLVQLSDIKKQNLSKDARKKATSSTLNKFGSIFVSELEEAGAALKIDKLAFSSNDYDLNLKAVVKAASEAKYGTIVDISLRVVDINRLSNLLNNSDISRNKKWKNFLDLLRLNRSIGTDWEIAGDTGRLFIKIKRDGHLTINNEDLGLAAHIFSKILKGPSPAPSYKGETLPSEVSVEDRMAKAKTLYSLGIIDEEAYEKITKQIKGIK